MSTLTTPHDLRALGLALIAGLFVCAPAHAYGGGYFGAAGHGDFVGGTVRAQAACLEGRGYSVK
jgi:hypothetical protein